MAFFVGALVLVNCFPLVTALLVESHKGGPQCVPLHNRFSYFGVEVSVGTPSPGTDVQTFEVVADTGSNNLIVPSCVCQEHQNGCSGAEHCFRGINRSTTFEINEHPRMSWLTFGSGTIGAVLATDVATVGEVSATMDGGLLLMVDDTALRIQGPFEGILGLGVPTASFSLLGSEGKTYSPGGALRSSPQKSRALRGGFPSHMTAPANPEDGAATSDPVTLESPKSFLEEAKINTFSMCFSNGDEGAMRFNAEVSNLLESVGKDHWGLGLEGVTVNGADAVTSSFCQSGAPDAGTQTPCGAIPDSGTTLIMGAPSHIQALYATMCDQWQLCNDAFNTVMKEAEKAAAQFEPEAHEIRMLSRQASLRLMQQFPLPDQTAQGEGMTEEQELEMVKAAIFVRTLLKCDEWEDYDATFTSLPNLTWSLVDAAGHKQDLKLSPWAYVMETESDKNLELISDRRWSNFLQTDLALQKAQKVCVATFDTMDYPTAANGQVWILGSPFFYAYEIGFQLNSPAMSFTSLGSEGSGCQTCAGTTALGQTAASRDDAGPAASTMTRRVRKLRAPPRAPKVDTTKPF